MLKVEIDFIFLILCAICIFYFFYAYSRDKDKGDFISKRDQELVCWIIYTISAILIYGGINWW